MELIHVKTEMTEVTLMNSTGPDPDDVSLAVLNVRESKFKLPGSEESPSVSITENVVIVTGQQIQTAIETTTTTKIPWTTTEKEAPQPSTT